MYVTHSDHGFAGFPWYMNKCWNGPLFVPGSNNSNINPPRADLSCTRYCTFDRIKIITIINIINIIIK